MAFWMHLRSHGRIYLIHGTENCVRQAPHRLAFLSRFLRAKSHLKREIGSLFTRSDNENTATRNHKSKHFTRLGWILILHANVSIDRSEYIPMLGYKLRDATTIACAIEIELQESITWRYFNVTMLAEEICPTLTIDIQLRHHQHVFSISDDRIHRIHSSFSNKNIHSTIQSGKNSFYKNKKFSQAME